MTVISTVCFCALGAYLIGAIPFGYLIGKWRGINIFEHGSGNLGATNVGRVLGKRFGILVFVLDFMKGALPVLAVLHLVRVDDYPSELFAIAAGMGAFLGHLFPVYLKFRGGKGVATGAGIVAVLLPGPTVGAVVTWVLVLTLTRYVSVASMSAGLMLYLLQTSLVAHPFAGPAASLTYFCAVAAALVIARHFSNIRRLFAGTEGQLKENALARKLSRIVHVLALGFWFGGAALFSFVATPIIFDAFGKLVENRTGSRLEWMPANITKLQASQLAGIAVSPIFPWYFLLQGMCGVLALATAFRNTAGKTLDRFERWRVGILALGIATILVALPLTQRVDALRTARAQGDEAAIAAFASWHLVSLLLNFVTVGLAAAAMGMAAFLPGAVSAPEKPST
jgi:acyl-phosphate glycerol 3-phosphate acyltransferase